MGGEDANITGCFESQVCESDCKGLAVSGNSHAHPSPGKAVTAEAARRASLSTGADCELGQIAEVRGWREAGPGFRAPAWPALFVQTVFTYTVCATAVLVL